MERNEYNGTLQVDLSVFSLVQWCSRANRNLSSTRILNLMTTKNTKLIIKVLIADHHGPVQ